MALTTKRDGPYVSIGLKIFTLALVLLALMCAVTGLTVYMAASVGRELRDLGHGYVEGYAALARANIRSVERALYLRRLYINARDGEGQATSEELRRQADEAGASGERELAAGHVPGSGVGAVGRWPAAATATGLA
jgi:hypothetical protein